MPSQKLENHIPYWEWVCRCVAIITTSLCILRGEVVISEFQRFNTRTLADEDGEYHPWIELYNAGDSDVSLEDYTLSDDLSAPGKWLLPAVNLGSGEYLVIIASGKDRKPLSGELHTNFNFANGNGYLSLRAAEGQALLSEFDLGLQTQFAELSYGVGFAMTPVPLISPTSGVQVLVPEDDTLGESWAAADFDASSWLSGSGAVGFGYPEDVSVDLQGAMSGLRNGGYARFPFSVSNPSSVEKLNLDMRYDDGFVAYLNGVEVVQRNSPSSGLLDGNLLGYTAATNLAGKQTELLTINVLRGGIEFEYSVDELIGVSLMHFKAGTNLSVLTSPAGSPLAASGTRSAAIEDDSLVTGVINPGSQASPPAVDPTTESPGMTLVFNTPVSNGPGPDVVFFELHNAAGTVDRFHITPLDGVDGGGGKHSVTVSSYAIPFASAAEMADFDLWQSAGVIDDLQGLENNGFSKSGGVLSGFRIVATGIDLSSLGFAAGESCTGLHITGTAVNGVDPVFVAGLPQLEGAALQWDSTALGKRDAGAALTAEHIDLSGHKGLLRAGNNVLAIHGLNSSRNDPDFLIKPELADEKLLPINGVNLYFKKPTPGSLNTDGLEEYFPPVDAGVTQVSFSASELGKIIGTFPSPGIQPTAMDFQHGQMLIGSGNTDAQASGQDIWYDISDPRNPVKTTSLVAAGHKVHTLASWGDYGMSGHVATTGMRVLDLKNRSAFDSVDADVFPIWISVQAPFVYRAENGYRDRSNRMKVYSVADPTAPVELANVDFGSDLSFYPANTHVVGNLLIASATQQKGVAVFDIGDPLHPRLLSSLVAGNISYTSMVYGSRIYTGETNRGVRVYDFSNPNRIQEIGLIPVPGNPRYVSLKEGKGYVIPNSRQLVVFDTTKDPSLAVETIHAGLASSADYTFPVGNMIATGGLSSANLCGLIAVEREPDTKGPEVTFASPADGSVNLPVTSRFGFIMSDQIDVTSLDTESFSVREIGGDTLGGTYSTQNGIINFCPDQPLETGKIYEVVLAAGGIRDSVGNATERTYRQVVSTGNALDLPPVIESVTSSGRFSEVGEEITFSVSASDSDDDALEYEWDFGDGSVSSPSVSSEVTHQYQASGRYSVIARVSDGATTVSKTMLQVVTRALANTPPSHSSTMAVDGAGKVWVVNPDHDSVSRIDAEAGVKELELPAPRTPRHLWVSHVRNELWVSGSAGDALMVYDTGNGDETGGLKFGYGAQPQGMVASSDGDFLYVALAGPGEIVKVDVAARSEVARLKVGPYPRELAVVGSRLFAGCFISPRDRGEIWEIDLDTFSLVRTHVLEEDVGPDSPNSSRGVPNYLTGLAVSPDANRLFIASKKDNTCRGLLRDGQELRADLTVRSIISQVDLTNNMELVSARRDTDNHGLPSEMVFSPRGDLYFTAYQDNNEVLVFDAVSGNQIGGISLGGGLTPRGLALNADATRLFVDNYLTRTLSVFDVSELTEATGSTIQALAVVPTVAIESLPTQVLRGKQIFHNAGDLRMSGEGYLSCATCHFDGGHDGRVWDFTDRGEGLRNTTDLRGRAGMGHGLVHWSGNFDEIQDFEQDIRSHFGGLGFMHDADFQSGSRSSSLGDAKEGLSPDLDALAAYLASLTKMPASPFRDENGNMTPPAISGREHFQSLSCSVCHSADRFTDSGKAELHDIGTLLPSSGNRLGGELLGIDTPTLRGLWEGAPYLHDGRADLLEEVFSVENAPAGSAHAAFRNLSQTEQDELLEFLKQLDYPRGEVAADATSPAVPGVLEAVVVGSDRIDLTWFTAGAFAETYMIEQTDDIGGTSEQVVSGLENALAVVGLDAATDYSFRIRSRNVHGDSPWIGSVTARTYSLFRQWVIDSGFPVDVDADLDDEKDGMTLWLEYALGLNPKVSDAGDGTTVKMVGGMLQLEYLRMRQEIGYDVETSTDLLDWSAMTVDQGIQDADKRVRATVPFDAMEPMRYMRLRVTGSRD